MKKFFPNLIYLLLGLPLGVLYFVILVTGFSLGAGLSITLVGVPILVAMIFVTYILGDLERSVTSKLLGIKIVKPEARPANNDSAAAILVAQLRSGQFWKELVYLILKMPVGIISFTLAVTFVSVSLALLLAPVIVSFFPSAQIMLWNGYEVTSMQQAFLASGIGLIFGAVSVLLINGFAALLGFLGRWGLGGASQ